MPFEREHRSMPPRPLDREALVEALRRRLGARPEIVFAVLHGSFTAGGPYRDVDVAVWVTPDRRPDTGWHRYALDLGAELTVALDAPVDVQVLNEAPLGFRYHALNGRQLLVRDEEFFHTVRERTWDEYFDFLPFARENLRQMLRG
jgi:predicted nucleotidyltransferase